jgi:hypothetical protein
MRVRTSRPMKTASIHDTSLSVRVGAVGEAHGRTRGTVPDFSLVKERLSFSECGTGERISLFPGVTQPRAYNGFAGRRQSPLWQALRCLIRTLPILESPTIPLPDGRHR